MSRFEFDDDQGVVTEHRREVKQPKKYKVILLNDDYTSMEFVVYVLETVFHKSHQEAMTLMLSIHNSNRGVAGVYALEIAEMKVAITTELAKKHEYPLRCILEEE